MCAQAKAFASGLAEDFSSSFVRYRSRVGFLAGSSNRKRPPASQLGLLLLAVAGLSIACGSAHQFRGERLEPPQLARDIHGTNWDGNEFRLSDQRGKVVLLFFGYTSCPDVCPATLSSMKAVYKALGPRADEVSVVLVSLDPQRDTPERIGKYLSVFDERFFGLYLEPEVLAVARKAYRIVVEKRYPETGRSASSYFLDHSSWLFAIDREGQLRLRFPFAASSAEIVADVEFLLDAPPPETSAVASAPALRIEAAWVRPAPSGFASAAYLDIVNGSASDDRLLSVVAATAENAMVHETTLRENGVMHMRHAADGVPVPGHSTVRFEPGSRHIMLMGLEKGLESGETLDLVLNFEKAGAIEVAVPVRERSGGA